MKLTEMDYPPEADLPMAREDGASSACPIGGQVKIRRWTIG